MSRAVRAAAVAAGFAVAATALGGAPQQASIFERVPELERRVEALGEHAAMAEDLLELRTIRDVGLASWRTRNLARIVEGQHLKLREYPEWQELLRGSRDCDAAKDAVRSLLEATQ